MLRRPWLVLPLVSAFALSTPLAIGWPEKPIRLVVTFPAGVVSDSVARAIAEPLSRAPGLNERYFGISGPAGMPVSVTERLASALDDVLAEPAVARRFTELGITPRKATSAAFTAFVARQADWRPALAVAELHP